MLTMLTQSGSGTLAGGAHTDTWKTLSRARGKRISELLQRSFDRPALSAEFPGKPVLAYFSLSVNEEQDVGDVVSHAVQIRAAFPNHHMDPDEFQEKTGYRLVDYTPPPSPPAFGGGYSPFAQDAPRAQDEPALEARERFGWLRRLFGRQTQTQRNAEAVQESLLEATLAAALQADRSDNLDLARRLYAALAEPDQARMVASLIALQQDLPRIAATSLDSPELARVHAEALSAALLNGVAEGAARRPQPGRTA
jgi:hypothetical protein